MSKITVIGSLFFYGNKYKAAVFFSRIELRGDNVVRQIKSTTIRHFILTGIAEKRSNKAYYKHLIRQIK